MSADLLTTDRLFLRRWLPSDREPFAELNADPRVMEHFPNLLTREQSDAMIDRLEGVFEAEGLGLWAVEVKATGEFIGFIGVAPVPFEEHFTPALEIGWRLAFAGWGHGYATEGARAAMDHAFGSAGRSEVVSMTATTNLRSQAVMRRLGMTCDRADDFDHPRVNDDRLRRHVLFRITAAQWAEQ